MFSFSWKSWLCLLRAWKNINQKRGELQNYFEAQLSLWNALARQSNAYQISAFCLKLQPQSIWVFICHRSTYFRPFGQWPLPILSELKPQLQLRTYTSRQKKDNLDENIWKPRFVLHNCIEVKPRICRRFQIWVLLPIGCTIAQQTPQSKVSGRGCSDLKTQCRIYQCAPHWNNTFTAAFYNYTPTFLNQLTSNKSVRGCACR